METNNKEDILIKIANINKQIAIRETIPVNLRTDKQSIKLDNLLYELSKLYDIINKDEHTKEE